MTVRDATGEVTVPVTDRDVVALDEYAALQLLAVGVTVRAAATFFQDATAASVLQRAGVEMLKAPSAETVLAERPALVVGTGHPDHIKAKPSYTPVVPVVLPDFTQGWDEQLGVLATATGREQQAQKVVRKVQTRLDGLVAGVEQAGLRGRTVSIMAAYPDNTFFAFGPTILAGQFVEKAGLTRPPAQRGAGDFGFIPISAELLPQQRADFFFSLTGASTDNVSVADNRLLISPSMKVGVVDASAWGVATPLSAWWILGDLEAVLLGKGTVATADQVATIWADLLA